MDHQRAAHFHVHAGIVPVASGLQRRLDRFKSLMGLIGQPELCLIAIVPEGQQILHPESRVEIGQLSHQIPAGLSGLQPFTGKVHLFQCHILVSFQQQGPMSAKVS